MTFYPSTPPFDDFCLHLRQGPGAAPWGGDLLTPKDRRIGGAVDEVLGTGAQRLQLLLRGDGNLTLHFVRGPAISDANGMVFLEGVANHGETPLLPGKEACELIGRLGRRIATEPVLRGHFTGVCQVGDKILVFTDWLGLGHLYRVALPGHHLVSNRLHLLAKVLKGLGRLRFRPEGIAQSLVMDTSFTHETPVEGVVLVPASRFLEVDAEGVHERTRWDVLAELRGLGTHAYEDLLRRAAEEIKDNCRAVAVLAQPRSRILYLTGGIDSRVVLAGCVAAGTRPRWYYTYGEREAADRRIAALLAARTGLTRIDDRDASLPSAAHAVDHWFSLNYHQRAASLLPVRIPSRDRVRVGGGCGECYRGFYSQMVRNKCGRALELGQHPRALAKLIADTMSRWGLVHREVRASFEEGLERTIQAEPLVLGTSAYVDGLYPLFRNRFHFGLGLRLESAPALKLAPLYSPSALLASLLCDYRDRHQGRVMHDLMKLLAPELLEVEYDPQGFPLAWTSSLPEIAAQPWPRPAETWREEPTAPPPSLPPDRRAEYETQLWEALAQVRQFLQAQDPAYFGLINRGALLTAMARAESTRQVKKARRLLMSARLLEEAATESPRTTPWSGLWSRIRSGLARSR